MQDNDGDTALMYASRSNKLKVVELLLQRGANLSLRNKRGRTAVIYAINLGYRDVRFKLIEYGADYRLRQY